MKLFILLFSLALTLAGFNVEGVVGIREDETGNGRIIYNTKYEVDGYYNYINYESGEVGEEIGTILLLGDSGEPDDYILRIDY